MILIGPIRLNPSFEGFPALWDHPGQERCDDCEDGEHYVGRGVQLLSEDLEERALRIAEAPYGRTTRRWRTPAVALVLKSGAEGSRQVCNRGSHDAVE